MLRIRASQSKESAAAYDRQSHKPIYDGQDAECQRLSSRAEAYASKFIAKADRLDAEADLLEMEN